MSVFDRPAILQAASEEAAAQEDHVKAAMKSEFNRIAVQLVRDFASKADFSVVQLTELEVRTRLIAWKVVQEQLEMAGFGVVFVPQLVPDGGLPSCLRCYRSKFDIPKQ